VQQETITFVVAGLGILSTVGGIVISHFLTRSNQHQQWLRDRRLDEYKTVLAAVNEMFEAHAVGSIMANDMDTALRQRETVGRCFRTIANCVMIADDLKKIELFQTLINCQGHFDLTQNSAGFGSDRRIIIGLLIKMAHESLDS
jgi:hypothetical protein